MSAVDTLERPWPRWMSAETAAAYLCVSTAQLRRLVDANRIPAPIYLSERTPRFDRAAIDNALTKGGNGRSIEDAIAQIGRKTPGAVRRKGRERQGLRVRSPAQTQAENG
jgi:excisionase family DNA binding protein